VPPPAIVVMMPVSASTRRMRCLHFRNEQITGRSAATPVGRCRHALMAGPPSPPETGVPFPATVVMVAAGFHSPNAVLRMSAMKRPPKGVHRQIPG